MTHTSVALDFSQAMNALSDLTTKWTFDRVFSLEQAGQSAQLVLVQFSRLLRDVNFRFDASFSRYSWPDAIQILKRINDLLIVRDVNTEQTRHSCPLLRLLLVRV
jgi:hypothetical protein